jgi:hypothetical protein
MSKILNWSNVNEKFPKSYFLIIKQNHNIKSITCKIKLST